MKKFKKKLVEDPSKHIKEENVYSIVWKRRYAGDVYIWNLHSVLFTGILNNFLQTILSANSRFDKHMKRKNYIYCTFQNVMCLFQKWIKLVKSKPLIESLAILRVTAMYTDFIENFYAMLKFLMIVMLEY